LPIPVVGHSFALCGDSRDHAAARFDDIFMLPDADDFPAGRLESSVRVEIALPCPVKFCLPPLSVGSGQSPVLVACVPPTGVDEDRHPGTREEDIRLSTNARDGTPVHEIAESVAENFGAEREFDCRVVTALLLHLLPNRWRRCEGLGCHAAYIVPHRP